VEKHAKEPWMVLHMERWPKAPIQKEAIALRKRRADRQYRSLTEAITSTRGWPGIHVQ
jgi:hypothetical protein